MPEFENNNQNGASPLTPKQKWAAGFLAVFAVVFLILWVSQFKNSIQQPLNSTDQSQINQQSDQSQSAANDAALKNKDTDGDGLSDWDEIHIYHTSPYLADTDGDGIPDGVEVRNGTDPNCPQGRTCNSGGVTQSDNFVDNTPTSSIDTIGSTTPDLNGNSSNFNLNLQNQNPSTTQELLGGQMDAQTLRAMLLQSGMDPNVLNKISDDNLMKSYQQTLQGTSTGQ